jgi:hypothetical protein
MHAGQQRIFKIALTSPPLPYYYLDEVATIAVI